jgi:CheY-like chemotaxis protein
LTVRKIVIRYLLKHGYDQIDEAVNGHEAIELIKQHEYGCIFLDINMPVLDGFAVLEWLRAVSWRSRVHVVVMSTEVTQFSPKKIREMGIDTAMAKPFTGDEFEKTAVSLLNVIDSEENTETLIYDGPILIIDDSMAMRNIIRKQLSNLNCLNVTEAVDGKDGLEKIIEWSMLYEENEKMGILFLDLIMPNMDGLQLIEMLEEKDLLSRLYIVLLSGNVEMALDMIDGNSIKAALPKPFEYAAFVRTVD